MPGRLLLDPLERAIVTALQKDARAPWAKIAACTHSSTTTVRRRYEALQAGGAIRVVGRYDVTRLGLGISTLLLVSGRESSHRELLEALKRRNDVCYLSSGIGPIGCFAEIITPSLVELQATIADITGRFDVHVEPAVVTHTYTYGEDWIPGIVHRSIRTEAVERLPALTDEELSILGELQQNGRASLGHLARAIGKSEATARRSLDSLISRGIVSFRVLVEPASVGFASELWLRLEVESSRVAEVGAALASHVSTKTLAATAGRHALIGQFVLPSHTSVHAFTTDVLASIPGLRGTEMTLRERTYKRLWNIVSEERYGEAVVPWWFSTSADRHPG